MHVNADKPLAVRSIGARFRGERRTRHSDLAWHREVFFDHDVAISGPGTIEGPLRYPVSFQVPPGLPPTYHGLATKVAYRFDVVADVPYWFDWKARVEPEVGVSPVGPIHARPVTSRAPSWAMPSPIEVRVDSSLLRLGGRLRGAAALLDVTPSDPYVLVRATLEAREVSAWSREARLVYERAYTIPVRAPFEGQVVPFEIAIPDDMGCSYRDHVMGIVWMLRVSRVRWGVVSESADVPLVVYPAASVILPSGQPITLLGAERTYSWWNGVAVRFGLHFDGSTLNGTIGGSEVRIERVIDPERGPVIVGSVRYPTLGLDLSISPERRHWLSSRADLALGVDPSWDRHHRVEARDVGQLEAFAAALTVRPEFFQRLDMDDEQLRAIEPDSFTGPEAVAGLADRLVGFARGLPSARAAIPVPASMAAHAKAWQQLAAELDGGFEPASVRVWAVIQGANVWLWTELGFDGAPVATRIAIQPAWQLGRDRHFRAEDEIVATAAEKLGAPLGRVEHAFRDVTWACIDEGGLHLRLPAPYPDPLRLAGRVRSLQQILARARPGATAFR